MNTSQVIIGLAASIGVLLIGWYLYMQQTPSYERTFKRGLEVQAVDSSKGVAMPVKAAPKPQPIPVKAAAEPAKTGAATVTPRQSQSRPKLRQLQQHLQPTLPRCQR